MAVEEEYHKRGTRGGAYNKKRVWWELQEQVIDEVEQRFGFTPPKLQWEPGSEVQLVALRAWNRDIADQRWEELHRWHQPTALRIRAIREEERRAAAIGAASANPVPATPTSPAPSTPPQQQQTAQPSSTQQARSPAEAWLSAPDLPTARTAALGAVPDSAPRARASTTSPRSVSRQVLRAAYSRVRIVLRSRSRSRTPTPIQEAAALGAAGELSSREPSGARRTPRPETRRSSRGRSRSVPSRTSPTDRPIVLAPRSSAYPTVRIDRTGTWTLQREQPSGAPRPVAGRAHSRLPQFSDPHELPTDVWLRPEAYGERSRSPTPNYGRAEVYHLGDYSDEDPAHTAEDLLSGRAAFREGEVYEAPFHTNTVPALSSASAAKATAKCEPRPKARGSVAGFLASSRGRIPNKARSSSPPRLAALPARKVSVPADNRPGSHIRFKQPPASLRSSSRGQGAAFGAPDPPWRQPPRREPPKPPPPRRESHGIPDPPPRPPLADRKTLNIVLDWHGVLDVNIRSGGRLHPQIVDGLIRLQTAHGPFNWIICSYCGAERERTTAPEIATARVHLAYKGIYVGTTQFTRSRVGVAGKANLLHGWAAHILVDDNATICREARLTGAHAFRAYPSQGVQGTLDALIAVEQWLDQADRANMQPARALTAAELLEEVRRY